MTRVDDAFGRLKSNLEITATEQRQAANRHGLIRDHVRSRWQLDDDFLTGSYDRHTKTKKLKDVDIFVVVDPDGPQSGLVDGTGKAAVDALADVLATRWTVETDDTVVRISYSDEEVASYEVAPAFATSQGYLIPNGATWMATNPQTHAQLVSAANAQLDKKLVPLIKMIKATNREHGDLIGPSFLLEVMALDLVRPPASSYKQEITYFFSAAADAILENWPDPAGLGDDVNAHMTTHDRTVAANQFRDWQLAAEHALRLEQRGDDTAAIEQWRTLFGSRMTRA